MYKYNYKQKKMEKKETPIKTKMDTTGTFRTIKVGNCVTFNEDDVNLESLRTTASYMKRRGIGEYRVEKVTKDNKSAIRVSRIA